MSFMTGSATATGCASFLLPLPSSSSSSSSSFSQYVSNNNYAGHNVTQCVLFLNPRLNSSPTTIRINYSSSPSPSPSPSPSSSSSSSWMNAIVVSGLMNRQESIRQEIHPVVSASASNSSRSDHKNLLNINNNSNSPMTMVPSPSPPPPASSSSASASSSSSPPTTTTTIDPREPEYHKSSRAFYKTANRDSFNGNVEAEGIVISGHDDENMVNYGLSSTTAGSAVNGSVMKNVPVNAGGYGCLDPSGTSFKEKFLIRCYEVGMNGTASPETMANLLQEVACNHAQSVGFSTDGFATTTAMRKKRLIWVTTRMHIEVLQYPVWGNALEMETWCQCEGKAGTRRDWTIIDLATDRIVGRATSTWVMMNQDTRRLSRVPEDVLNELLQYYPTEPRYAFPEENSFSLKKIPKLQDPAQHIRSGLKPRRGDLDMNRHVNNVTYIGWVLESIPQNILETHQLHTITLDYRRECNYNDVVESFASLEGLMNGESEGCLSSNGGRDSDDLVFLHIVRLAGSHIEINRARTVWREKAIKKSSNASSDYN